MVRELMTVPGEVFHGYYHKWPQLPADVVSEAQLAAAIPEPSPDPPTEPEQDDTYFDTEVGTQYYYDANENKWITIAHMFMEMSGNSNNLSAGSYFHIGTAPVQPNNGYRMPRDAIVLSIALNQASIPATGVDVDIEHRVAGESAISLTGISVHPPFPITAVTTSPPYTFTIVGDQTTHFPNDAHVINSTGNDGDYTVISAVFGGVNTVITVNEVIPSGVANGDIFGRHNPYGTERLSPTDFHGLTIPQGNLLQGLVAPGSPNSANYPILLLEIAWYKDAYPDYAVVGGTQTPDVFYIAGDHTSDFPATSNARTIRSTSNDGDYTVVSSVYNAPNTEVTVNEDIPTATWDGALVALGV